MKGHRRCPKNPNHLFHEGLSACPFCLLSDEERGSKSQPIQKPVRAVHLVSSQNAAGPLLANNTSRDYWALAVACIALAGVCGYILSESLAAERGWWRLAALASGVASAALLVFVLLREFSRMKKATVLGSMLCLVLGSLMNSVNDRRYEANTRRASRNVGRTESGASFEASRRANEIARISASITKYEQWKSNAASIEDATRRKQVTELCDRQIAQGRKRLAELR